MRYLKLGESDGAGRRVADDQAGQLCPVCLGRAGNFPDAFWRILMPRFIAFLLGMPVTVLKGAADDGCGESKTKSDLLMSRPKMVGCWGSQQWPLFHYSISARSLVSVESTRGNCCGI